jgi:hypothetical protein
MKNLHKEAVVAIYYYPDHEKTMYVKGIYYNENDLEEDDTETYIVCSKIDGMSIDEDNTFWGRVPTRSEVKERYVEITYS